VRRIHKATTAGVILRLISTAPQHAVAGPAEAPPVTATSTSTSTELPARTVGDVVLDESRGQIFVSMPTQDTSGVSGTAEASDGFGTFF
jgi:hypothetical protein